MTTERPLAEQLARQILDNRSDLQWLAPLAREYLKHLEAADEHAAIVSPRVPQKP